MKNWAINFRSLADQLYRLSFPLSYYLLHSERLTSPEPYTPFVGVSRIIQPLLKTSHSCVA